MEILKAGPLNKYDTLIIPFDNELKLNCQLEEILSRPALAAINEKLFKGEYEEIFTLTALNKDKIINLVLLGLGEAKDLSNREFFIAFSKAFSACRGLKARRIRVLLDNTKAYTHKHIVAEKICESALLANYAFNYYKTKFTPNTVEKIEFKTDYPGFDKALEEAKICGESIMLSRDLINHPAMFMTPGQLAIEAQKLAGENNLEISVFDEDKIKELGMNAFLAVGQGSKHKPKLIVMRYNGNKKSREIIGLVGKGLMYDSGGYCLKPYSALPFMHGDMAGAAAVIGAMRAIARMNFKVNAVGVIAACENVISSEAYLPGDIIKSMAGKNIEVNNSDAEGRLTLADAVTYAIREEKAAKIIDIATLTGAVVEALGNRTAGIISNNDKLVETAFEASKAACEKVWRLPADKELRHALNSCIADIRNCSYDGSNIGGGAIMGGLFIQEFVEEKPWMHIDIVGTGWVSQDLPYCTKGGLGYGTSLLINILRLLSA